MASFSDEEWEQIPSTKTVDIHKPKRSPQEARLFYKQVREHAHKILHSHRSRVFATDIDYHSIRQAYLDNLPAQYNCSTCRKFLKQVGGLVLVDDSGKLMPLFWPSKVSGRFEEAVASINTLFQDAKVVTEYKIYTSEVGKAEHGGFHHFHMDFPSSRRATRAPRGVTTLATSEAASMLDRILTDYSAESVKKAHQALTQHKLPNADNHIASAKWLLNLVTSNRIPSTAGVARQNLIYHYAVTAHTGCLSQLRSGPLSILLIGFEANKSFEEIKTQWTALTKSEVYMRPTVAPKEGNVIASERLFNELGLTTNDTRRRFLCVDDVPADVYLWQRKTKQKISNLKIFSHVQTKLTPKASSTSASTTDLPGTPISFTKLITQILPKATRVFIKLTPHHSINFLITGHENTAPLMQWHNDHNRASSYVYISPRHVTKHNLRPDAWNEVHGLISSPWLWDVHSTIGTFPIPGDEELRKQVDHVHMKAGLRYVFLLDNVVDKETATLCLFPEWLRGELHGVRSTIERFSRQGNKEVPEDIAERGGFVGGVGYGRGKDDGPLVKTEGGEEGVWKIVCFE